MRRILTLFLALCLWIPWKAALAETFVVDVSGGEEEDSFALLLRDDGTALTPLEEYASITPLTPEGTPEADRRYAVEPASLAVDLEGRDIDTLDYWDYHRVALMDGDGSLLTGFDYFELTWLRDGSIAFEVPGNRDTLAGVMDAKGHVLIPPKYGSITSMTEGRWLATMPEAADERYAVVTVGADGTETDTGLHISYPYLPRNATEPCPIEGALEAGRRTVYVGAEGKMAFHRSFGGGNPFYGSLAVVEDEDGYGLIDRKGQFVVPAEYNYIQCDTSVEPKVYAAERGVELTLIDAMTGEMLMRRDFAPAEYISCNLSMPGMVWVYAGKTLYALALDGTELGAFHEGEDLYYQAVKCAPDALRAIESVGTWPDQRARLMDGQGQPLSAAYRFITELLWQNGAGRYVYALMPDTEKQKATNWRHWRYGVIDENGRELLPPVYLDYIQALSPDRYWVTTADRTGMIDGSGKWYYSIENYAYLMD